MSLIGSAVCLAGWLDFSVTLVDLRVSLELVVFSCQHYATFLDLRHVFEYKYATDGLLVAQNGR